MDTIVPGRDYFVEVLAQVFSDPDGNPSPTDDASGIRVWYSDTEAGEPIAPALDLTTFAASGSRWIPDARGTPQEWARYLATLAGEDTAEPLADYVGQVIYRNEQIGTHDASSIPMRVRWRDG